jgi:hypothetical protein
MKSNKFILVGAAILFLISAATAVTNTYAINGNPCGIAGITLASDWGQYHIGDTKIISDLRDSPVYNTTEMAPDNQLVLINVPRNLINQTQAKTTTNKTISSNTVQINQWEEVQARGVCGNCYAVKYSFTSVPMDGVVNNGVPLFDSTPTYAFRPNETTRADYMAQVWSNGTKKIIRQFRNDKEILVTERVDNRSRTFYQGLDFPNCNPNTVVAKEIKETPCTECSPCKYGSGQPNALGFCDTQVNKYNLVIANPKGKVGFVGKR